MPKWALSARVLDQLKATLGGAEAPETHVNEREVPIAMRPSELQIECIDLPLCLVSEIQGFPVFAPQCQGVREREGK